MWSIHFNELYTKYLYRSENKIFRTVIRNVVSIFYYLARHLAAHNFYGTNYILNTICGCYDLIFDNAKSDNFNSMPNRSPGSKGEKLKKWFLEFHRSGLLLFSNS